MATFYAVTTENTAACGWTVLGVASTKAAAEAEANSKITGNGIHAETRRTNLRVVSRSAAIRAGMFRREQFPTLDREANTYVMER